MGILVCSHPFRGAEYCSRSRGAGQGVLGVDNLTYLTGRVGRGRGVRVGEVKSASGVTVHIHEGWYGDVLCQLKNQPPKTYPFPYPHPRPKFGHSFPKVLGWA